MDKTIEIELRPHIGIQQDPRLGPIEIEHPQWIVLAKIITSSGTVLFNRQVGFLPHDQNGNAAGQLAAIHEFRKLPSAYRDAVMHAIEEKTGATDVVLPPTLEATE